ncbi:hypothetical protein M5K25_018748 [Dendrobium thyrsiflorum]|uniref:Uncharacterized protein n=1 Tax=Dendrobium thyrsiflorum TaxID=117978 RepID=A0ABD0UK02_DENTH
MSKNGHGDPKNVRFDLSGTEIGPRSGPGWTSRRRPPPAAAGRRSAGGKPGQMRALRRARARAGGPRSGRAGGPLGLRPGRAAARLGLARAARWPAWARPWPRVGPPGPALARAWARLAGRWLGARGGRLSYTNESPVVAHRQIASNANPLVLSVDKLLVFVVNLFIDNYIFSLVFIGEPFLNGDGTILPLFRCTWVTSSNSGIRSRQLQQQKFVATGNTAAKAGVHQGLYQ